MELIVVGLSHHTAPLALREQAVVPPEETPRALAGLVHDAGFREALVLSTCNRTELYVRGHGGEDASRALAFFESLRPAVWRELKDHVRVREDADAVRHLFRVAAGLESLVLGDEGIAKQMSDAYALACSAGAAGPVLHRAVPRALQVGRRVRSETSIGRGIASVAGAAAGLAERVFRDVSTCGVLVVGAGDTAETALVALRQRAKGRLVVANRTSARAEALAARHGGTAAPLDDVARLAAEADIVVLTTAAPEPLLVAQDLERGLRRRGARPLLVLDLGVPRNAQAAVGELPGVFLHTIDDLHAIADRGRADRAAEIPKAEAIVTAAVSDFRRRRRDLEAAPAIKALLDGLLDVRQASLVGEKDLTAAERAAAERVTGKLVDKLLRRLAPRLKDGTVTPREILDAFGIEEPEEGA